MSRARVGITEQSDPVGFAQDWVRDDNDRAWQGPWFPPAGVKGFAEAATSVNAGWVHGSALQKKRTPPPAVGDYGDLRGKMEEMQDAVEEFPITIHLAEADIIVAVDPESGPRWGLEANDYCNLRFVAKASRIPHKLWPDMTRTEKELCLIQVAKKILVIRTQRCLPLTVDPTDAVLGDEDLDTRSPDEIEAEVRRRIKERCEMEMKRPVRQWVNITIETVTENSSRKSSGMIYGIEFPWTEKMLGEFGPEWLTNAFRKAGTLGLDNQVTKVVLDNKEKITTGNNGGKFFFDVKYEKKNAALHTKLFAKVPFPLTGATRTDRLSSSVNKQPAELHEINTYRLLEATLPTKMPRFYFGDISNDTSNWIIITERIDFGDPVKLNFGSPQPRKGPLAHGVIEGPYDKCLDHCLRGISREYYLLLIKKGAMIAGMAKSGKLAPTEVLGANFADMENKPVEFFGFAVNGASGEDPRSFKSTKLEPGITFFSEIAKSIYPAYVADVEFLNKFRRTLYLLNAYSSEISFWKHSDQNYIALTHPNMNVDNAYFWRNDDGKLDLGIFDFGGMGSMCLGHKLWWWVYCGEFEPFRKNLPVYIDAFIDTYEEYGGPRLDPKVLRMQVIISAMEQMKGLLAAVPQIFKMCPRKEWVDIKSRYDPRINRNVDGKSSLRLYVHCMHSIFRIVEEMGGDALLQQWIDDIYVGTWKLPAKDQSMINGTKFAPNRL